MRDYTAKGPKKVIQINEKELQQHLSTLSRIQYKKF